MVIPKTRNGTDGNGIEQKKIGLKQKNFSTIIIFHEFFFIKKIQFRLTKWRNL